MNIVWQKMNLSSLILFYVVTGTFKVVKSSQLLEKITITAGYSAELFL